MIRYVKGIFHPAIDGTCIVETAGGIGFLITLAGNSPLYRHLDGEEVKVYTLMTVREDDMSLYGFSSMEELELFRLLITVNGVGAKAGMAVMSILPVGELKRAIALEDAAALTAASGVGKRTAQRIVLELKDKMGEDALLGGKGGKGEAPVPTSQRREAVEALTALGYSKAEAEDAVGAIPDDGLTGEEYIRRALRNMKSFL